MAVTNQLIFEAVVNELSAFYNVKISILVLWTLVVAHC